MTLIRDESERNGWGVEEEVEGERGDMGEEGGGGGWGGVGEGEGEGVRTIGESNTRGRGEGAGAPRVKVTSRDCGAGSPDLDLKARLIGLQGRAEEAGGTRRIRVLGRMGNAGRR
jgi:hypothetical protein